MPVNSQWWLHVLLLVRTGNIEEEVGGKSLGSDEKLSLVDKQVGTLKIKETIEAYNSFSLTSYHTLHQITAQAFISYNNFLSRPLNETKFYYSRLHVPFIICNSSGEYCLMTPGDAHNQAK